MKTNAELTKILRDNRLKKTSIKIPAINTAESFWESFAQMVHDKTPNITRSRVMEFSESDNLEFVNKSGRLLKRFAKWYKSQYSQIDSAEMGIVGDCLQYFVNEGGLDFIFDFTDSINWNDGKFGHSGSCWWGDYSDSRATFENGGGWAIRFYGNESDENGIGRTWIIIQDSRLYCFNSYGVTRPNVSKCLKEFFAKNGIELHYSKCELYNSQDDDIPYINGGTGFVMYQHGDSVESDLRHDIDLEPENSMTCDSCGCRIDEDPYSDNYDTYCADCFFERYFYCERCSDRFDINDVCDCNGFSYCESCANSRGFYRCNDCNEWHQDTISYNYDEYCQDCLDDLGLMFCDKCGEYSDNEPISYNGEDYCPDCAENAGIVDCHKCGEYDEDSNMIEFENRHYCESCAKSEGIHICELCGAACMVKDMESYYGGLYCQKCLFVMAARGDLELIEA